MKYLSCVLCLLFFSAQTATCADFSTIHTLPKSSYMDQNIFFLSGHWTPITEKTYPPVPKLNAAQIYCAKRQNYCSEVVAGLVSETDNTPNMMIGLLHVDQHEYRIVEWSDETIRAIKEFPVANIELMISIGHRTAERSFRETRARGAETANPGNYKVWLLE